MNKFPTLTTDRLLLRQFSDTDLASVFQGLSHPDVIRYYGVSFHSLEATREQMDWFANLENTGTGLWWAICHPNTGQFYGAGGFNDLNREHRKAEIGFWLMPEAWGQGMMQEAMPAICSAGFEVLGLHRIEGFVDSKNENCKRALTKLAFVYEGTMRECEMKDGKWRSVDIYAKFKA